MLKLVLIALVVLFASAELCAQSPDWFHQVTGALNAWDYPWFIDIGPDGSVYVTGHVAIVAGTDWNCRTMKWNSDGVLQWSRNYHPAVDNNDGRRLVVDDAGNVYVAVLAYHSALRQIDLIKYDTDGNVQWVYSYSNGIDDLPVNMLLDDDCNVYILGRTANSSLSWDYCIMKVDSSGNELASTTWDSGNLEWARGMALNQNNLFVSGYTGEGDTDIYILKYDLALNLQQFEHFDRSYSDCEPLLVLSDLGDLYVYYTWRNGANDDIGLIKYDSNFNVQWSLDFGGSGGSNDIAAGIVLNSQDNVNIVGTVYNGSSTRRDVLVAEINSNGNIEWQETYNGSANRNDNGVGIALDQDDNVLVTGYETNSSNNKDILTLVYSSAGSLLKSFIYDVGGSSRDDDGKFIVADNAYHVYIAGVVGNTSDSSPDWGVLRYSYSVGIAEQELLESEGAGPRLTCYPQPASGSVTFGLEGLSSDDLVSSISDICIYDLSGTLVRTIAASGSTLINGGALCDLTSTPPGVYYCVIRVGDESISQKLLKIL